MATYITEDFGKLFFEGLKKSKKAKAKALLEAEVGVETPSLDVASEYQEGEDDASYGDLVELLGVLDEEHYNEVADILLDYMDDTYGDDEDDFYESDEDEDEDDDEDDEELEEAILAFLEEFPLSESLDDLSEDELVEIAKRFKGFKKSRKFFKKSASKMKVGKLKNKTANRVKRIKGRVKRKKTRFARKKYQKSRNTAIKVGRHVVKSHRGLKKK